MVMSGIVHSSGAFLLQYPHSMSENSLYLRATFFYNQMRVKNDVISSRISDFVIGKYTFEVGGRKKERKKGQKQIENILEAYIVKDDIEFAQGNVIPLWAFGLNYLMVGLELFLLFL